MRSISKKLFFSGILSIFVFFGLTVQAHALTKPTPTYSTFSLEDHPLTLGHPTGNVDPWSLTLGCPGCNGGVFDMLEGSFAVNTTPQSIYGGPAGSGSGLMEGRIVQRSTGQIFAFSVELGALRYLPGNTFPNGGSVPYTEMFDDMRADGYGAGGTLIWDKMLLELTPLTVLPDDTGFKGPLSWEGKPDVNGNQNYFAYRWHLDPAQYGKPYYDVFGFSGWFRPLDPNITGSGDIHVIARDERNPVPEPATMALMAFGLSGMGMIRRNKKQNA